MSKIDQLLAEYMSEHRDSGAVDPIAYLERLDGLERRELEALIDAYLARQPRRAFDPEAFAHSNAEQVAQALHRSLHGEAGMWPVVLPQLRKQAQLGADELVPRLASALGVPNQQEKVGDYYWAMEEGELAAGGVSDSVLQALAEIVNTTPNVLREAGGAPPPASYAPPAGARPDTGWDAVDELFRSASSD